jgi:hypothetical protein
VNAGGFKIQSGFDFIHRFRRRHNGLDGGLSKCATNFNRLPE